MSEKYKKISVRTWFLRFKGEVPQINQEFTCNHWINPPVDDYLSLYRRVGEKWGWTGRLTMPENELCRKLLDPENEVWLFKKDDKILGFFEIDRSIVGKAEIVYLGLIPEMIGKGYGKSFMDAAIAHASGIRKDIVWLHTCECDHPNALDIYIKSGFVVEEETIEEEYYPINFSENKNRRL